MHTDVHIAELKLMARIGDVEQTPAKVVGASEDRNETPQKEVRPAAAQQDFTLNGRADMTEAELFGSDEEAEAQSATAEQSLHVDDVAAPREANVFSDEEELGSEDEEEAMQQDFEQTRPPTPGVVKSRLRKLMTDKGLKVKDIQELIGERPGPCWNKFMNGKYKDQSWAYSNDAYRKAAFFFYKEKRLGAQGKLAHIVKKTAKNVKAVLPDLSDVPTDGKTYLTPAECRKSLLNTLKKYQLTQGKLAKMIGENPVMVGRFMTDGGEFGGSDKGCYHPLAQFCEKLRIATGAKKSPKRLAIEAEGRERPYLGADPTKRYVVMAGDSLYRARDAIGRPIVKCQRTH